MSDVVSSRKKIITRPSLIHISGIAYMGLANRLSNICHRHGHFA